MAWSDPTTPNLTDFTSFVYDSMGVPIAALPVNSPFIGYAFSRAIAEVASYPVLAPIEYVLAVYNCAGHVLLKIAPNPAGQSYFADVRGTGPLGYGLNSPQLGMVAATSDSGTSNTFATPDSFKSMTLSALDYMRTPWGRDYLAYVQDYGPTIWGLS